MARRVPEGGGFLREQADALMEECCTNRFALRRLRKGPDPWLLVYPPKEPWIPRYHSEPNLAQAS